MPIWVQLETNVAHPLKTDYTQLGELKDLGRAKVLGRKSPKWEGDSGKYSFRVVAPLGAEPSEVPSALYSTFLSVCECEHDCCGHINVFVARVRRIRRREWLVSMCWNRNV
jgi:hypothetical protein